MWRFLKKLEIELPYNPEIALLDIYSKETKIKRDTCTTIFIGRTDAEAETPILWPPNAKNDSLFRSG